MGEVVVSCEEVEMVRRESEGAKREEKKDGMVRWERFLPRVVIRVLLVEADDCTRQIISALLRKCSYKVAAVADGLKAWEIIKGRPENIDLILTEAELPSISGFALLTLIMEHDSCKNIPVIMMSSHDSVSMVYKCMLRGAADFLMKPIRKNELRNLWQHVWRRQSSTAGGHGRQDESVAQRKVEGTSENDTASNHSSGYIACVQRNKECNEKGNDDQSSCTKPDLEAESAYMENVQDLSQPKRSKSSAIDMKTITGQECPRLGQTLRTCEIEAGGSGIAASTNANITTQGEELQPEKHREDANITDETCGNSDVLVNSSIEAIDLIGAFDNHLQCNYRNSFSINGISKLDHNPHLDLSLRRSHTSGSENQVSDERQTLNHSDSSAFSRYINRSLQPMQSLLNSICNQQKECGINSDKHVSSILPSYNSDGSGPTFCTQKNVISLACGQSGQAEIALQCHQQRVLPVQVPVRGISFDGLCTSYGSVTPPTLYAQSNPSSNPSPSSAGQKETSFQVNPFHQPSAKTENCEQLYDRIDQNANTSTNRAHQQDSKLDSFEDRGQVSPATDQSANSSFCNGTASQLNSLGCGSVCGSNGNANPVTFVRPAPDSKNEVLTQDGNSHQPTQREAALTKFRLKRKDRCYEKKVRYESRKKLAEQRPRVKGQFVRQLHTDPSAAETENDYGNSLEN